MPYNPEYYIQLCEGHGLKKAKDLFAWKIISEKILASEKLKRGQELVKKRYNLKISQLEMKNFQKLLNISFFLIKFHYRIKYFFKLIKFLGREGFLF